MNVKTRDVRPAALERPKTKSDATGSTVNVPVVKADNPRAVVGGNTRSVEDITKDVQERLALDFEELEKTAAAELLKARDLPKVITNEAERAASAEMQRALRMIAKRTESHREAEKAPYRRMGEAVDGFFKAIGARLTGGADILQERSTAYTRKLENEERERREAEAAETRRKADAARKEALRLEEEAAKKRQAAIEADAKAEATRRQSTKAKADKAASDAHAATAAADAVRQQAAHLEQAAEHQQTAAGAKAADLVRSRTSGGALMTAKSKREIAIDNWDLIPLEKLRPYLSRAEIEKAVGKFVSITDGKEELPGVRVFYQTHADNR